MEIPDKSRMILSNWPSLSAILFVAGIWLFLPSSASAQVYPCVLTAPPAGGNAPNDAQLECDSPPPCNNLAVSGIYLTNQGANQITAKVDVTYVDEDGNTGTWSQPISVTLAPHTHSGIIGCAGAWCDPPPGCTVTPPVSTIAKAYVLQYRIEECDVTSSVGGQNQSDSCLVPPALQTCIRSSLSVGTYRLRAKVLLTGVRDTNNGQWVQSQGPLCINVVPDTQHDGGSFEQNHCDPNSSSQQLILEDLDVDSCFRIRAASWGRLVLPENPGDSHSELRGWGDNQVPLLNGGNCQSSMNSAWWSFVPEPDGVFEIQNKQSGACINARTESDGTNMVHGDIQTLGCSMADQGLWNMDLVSVPAAPQLSPDQVRFLTTRRRGRMPGPGPR